MARDITSDSDGVTEVGPAPAEIQAVVEGRHWDPFSVLGPSADQSTIVAHIPGAERVWAVNDSESHELEPYTSAPTVFHGPYVPYYRLRIQWPGGHVEERHDPYRFSPVLGEIDEYLLSEGTHHQLWRALGAHLITHEEVPGVHFAVWAPNAKRVSVVGNFNSWDHSAHPMRSRGATGVWELFIPGLGAGETYKYSILGENGQLPLKADPVGFGSEHAPHTASMVRDIDAHTWTDSDWLEVRGKAFDTSAPVSIYEVHLGSWKRVRDQHGERFMSYRELADELVNYAHHMGFTHIEIMPVSEHPFDGSWGYQPIGLYAPTIRYGTPEEFQAFVDAAHARGLGVIADWVPGHFPTDSHGLGNFDGTALYEHADPRQGFHPDWNTLIFNYGRPEVLSYLVSNALYWLSEYHLDGLRVDAVASMVYLDYSRKDNEWVPNRDGGRENYEAINFLQRTNTAAYGADDSVAIIAEESTAFPGVTKPVHAGGLGFGYKWNLGWMNDSLEYFAKDPVYRKYHQNQLTFGMTYAYSENYVLPISHDEVVHGKGSMYQRMPGSHEDKLGNLKLFYAYMWAFPGKKLLFMGQEFGQHHEWNHSASLDWDTLKDPGHVGVQNVVRDLNLFYRDQPAMHALDTDPRGFQWLLLEAVDDQVIAWMRRGNPGDPHVVVVLNCTPVERSNYRIAFPVPGRWHEALNTDSSHYGGANRGNCGAIDTEPVPCGTEAQSALLTLPPLTAIYFVEDQS
ncbi:1,4-alpha-glucan branching protein GlgB [Brevibacterium sp. UMB10442]|nr:1,4-alpha-glucan branching protein GlgB [Brevibacterium sp. UMB10442]